MEERRRGLRRGEDKTGIAILQAVSYVLAVVLGYTACAIIVLPTFEAVAAQLAACFAGTVTAVGLWFSVGKPMLENYKQLKADDMTRMQEEIVELRDEVTQLRKSQIDLLVQNRALLAQFSLKMGLEDTQGTAD